MEKDGIDASIGLEFSLELFKRYKKTGILQAHIRRFPGIQGPSTVYVYLTEGLVVSCYLEDKNGQHSPVSKDILIRFDNEKGPFEWSFRASSVTPTTSTPLPVSTTQPRFHNTGPLAYQIPTAIVSRMVASIPGERLLTLTIQQRRTFLLVWHQIDGQKTVQDIKTALTASLSETAVEETLHTLLTMQCIVIRT